MRWGRSLQRNTVSRVTPLVRPVQFSRDRKRARPHFWARSWSGWRRPACPIPFRPRARPAGRARPRTMVRRTARSARARVAPCRSRASGARQAEAGTAGALHARSGCLQCAPASPPLSRAAAAPAGRIPLLSHFVPLRPTFRPTLRSESHGIPPISAESRPFISCPRYPGISHFGPVQRPRRAALVQAVALVRHAVRRCRSGGPGRPGNRAMMGG